MKNILNIVERYKQLIMAIVRSYTASLGISFNNLAGTPPTNELSAKSLVTTAPAATTTLLPIVTPGKIVTFPPSYTSFQIVTELATARWSRRP